MRIRLHPRLVDRFPKGFRRGGLVFGRDFVAVETTQLSPERLQYLTGPLARRYLEIEGAPSAATSAPPGTPKEAVVAAEAAGVSLPGQPMKAEAERVTKREEGARRPARGRKATEE